MCIDGSTCAPRACASGAVSTAGSGLDDDRLFGQRGGAARRVARRRDHREHGLAEVAQFAVGEDRVVVHDRAAVVAAGDVGGGQHRDDARLCADAVERQPEQPAVRDRRQAQRRVQRADDLRQVVDIGRLAGHVQVRRLVRQRGTDDRCGGQIDPLVHGAASVRAHTLVAASGSGSAGRVSSQQRHSRFCATRSR
jgi:hypothetical protein